ncbi:MAG: hypothetical protein K0R65_154 [Crocinitomicaceae bacterium]|jgi:hypothetical protein|nr:hypothetical protein [Crocinitomicaceae bacterium]
MTRALKINVLVFVLLFTLTLPFPLHFIQHPAFSYEHIFIWLEQGICSVIGFNCDFQGHLYSDSPDLLVHTFFLVLISPLISWPLLKIRWLSPELLNKLYLLVCSYTLAFFLMKYGFDKVFKHQFYSPEPNILHTPFGKLDKDILYWSVMGKSYSYSLFSGLLEVLAGMLLFFRKTRKLGALLSFGVMLHVLMINFAYGIEVKILSSFLLLLSLLILLWYRRELLAFFIRENAVICRPEPEISLNFRLKRLIRFTLIFYIFFESTFLAFSTANFNDDNYPRPKFHGAYAVNGEHMLLAKELGLKQGTEIKRIFIHRQAYFIVQTAEDRFIDFAFRYLPGKNGIQLRNPQKTELYFQQNPGLKLEFQYHNNKQRVSLNKLAF